MSYIVILMSFTAIFPSIGYGLSIVYQMQKINLSFDWSALIRLYMTNLAVSTLVSTNFYCVKLHFFWDILIGWLNINLLSAESDQIKKVMGFCV
jgi:hypothetical protein